MGLRYVRDRYRVPARRGGRVWIDGRVGTITSASHHIRVRFDGERHSTPCHPTWRVEYLDDTNRIRTRM